MTHGGRARAGGDTRGDTRASSPRAGGRGGRASARQGRRVAGTGGPGYAAVIEMPGMAWREKAVGYSAAGRPPLGRSASGRSASGRRSGSSRAGSAAARMEPRSAYGRRPAPARRTRARPRRPGERPEPPLRLTRRGRVVLTTLGIAVACLLLSVLLWMIPPYPGG